MSVGIPVQIKLKDIKQHGLLVNYNDDGVEHHLEWYFKPVGYKCGHYFLDLNHSDIFLSRSKLQRLNMQFLYLITNKLLEFIKQVTAKCCWTGQTCSTENIKIISILKRASCASIPILRIDNSWQAGFNYEIVIDMNGWTISNTACHGQTELYSERNCFEKKGSKYDLASAHERFGHNAHCLREYHMPSSGIRFHIKCFRNLATAHRLYIFKWTRLSIMCSKLLNCSSTRCVL